MNIFNNIRDHYKFYINQGYPVFLHYSRLYDCDEWNELSIKGYIADWLLENKVRCRYTTSHTYFHLSDKEAIIYFLHKQDAILFKLMLI